MQEILYLSFAFNRGVCLVFNTDMLHYLPSCVQYPAYCELVMYITYGNFFWRKLSANALGLEVSHGSHLETSDQLLRVFT